MSVPPILLIVRSHGCQRISHPVCLNHPFCTRGVCPLNLQIPLNLIVYRELIGVLSQADGETNRIGIGEWLTILSATLPMSHLVGPDLPRVLVTIRSTPLSLA